jgi:RimJ/RimL family protein N-acetyltransferase
VKLFLVDPDNEAHLKALYMLLEEREKWQSISHKRMPTPLQHAIFVQRMVPEGHCAAAGEDGYAAWYLVTEMDSRIVGCIYLTDRDEIGVSIFKVDQGAGWGEAAVRMLMEKHGKRRYLANVAPANEPSRKLFEKLGFKLVQRTYSLEAE